MKIILILLPVAALVCGAFTGNLTEVSGAVLDGAGNAVTLAISLCGIMCLWSGIMKVAEECGAVLGNATTPLGIQAMEAIRQEEATGSGEASDNMIMLTVLNTASLQLIPATAAALRSAHGAESPMDILPCVWIVSAYAVTAAVLSAKVMSWFSKRREKRRDNN